MPMTPPGQDDGNVDPHDLEKVVTRIAEAFREVPMLEPNVDDVYWAHLEHCEECRATYEQVAGKSWAELLDEIENGTAPPQIGLLPAPLWHYYLPATLIAGLRLGRYLFVGVHPVGKDSAIYENVGLLTGAQWRAIVDAIAVGFEQKRGGRLENYYSRVLREWRSLQAERQGG